VPKGGIDPEQPFGERFLEIPLVVRWFQRAAFASGLVLSLFITSSAYLSGSSEAGTKSVGWQPLQVSGGPGPIVGAGMVYDKNLKEVILWGGGNQTVLGNTWSYTTSGWTRLAAGPVRIRAAVAYDRRIGKVIAFGGIAAAGAPLGDTWSFDGSAWQQISTVGPPAREGAVMAYYPPLKELVLFGGSPDTTPQDFGDTWTWTAAAGWQRLTPSTSPTARFGSAMAYDRKTHSLVLFGGEDAQGVENDTWEFNGATWTQVTSSALRPPSRVQQALTYDPLLGGIVMWGGVGAGGDLADTWLFADGEWTQLIVSGPTASQGQEAMMTYDPAIKAALLVGGGGSSGIQPSAEWLLSRE
jgi:Galactose oxidase, central domain